MARPSFPNHRKFRRLVAMLGLPEPHVLGLCEFLWLAAYENGNPELGDAIDVEAAARWCGESGALLYALLHCGGEGAGLVELVPGLVGRYQVHDLFDHAPAYVAKRAKREAERQAKGKTLSEIRAEAGRKRWSEANGRHLLAQQDSKRPPLASKREANGLPPAPAPAPAQEEQKPVPSRAPRAQGPQDESPTALEYPTDGKVQTWRLSEAQVAEWATLYPSLDVLAECRKALAWVKASSGRRKTASGMARFLTGWLGRATDRGGPSGAGGGFVPRRPGAQASIPVSAAESYDGVIEPLEENR